MEYKDYYKLLGVDRKAKDEEIKRAYRKLAKQHHPDRNPGDHRAEETFKEINEAYQVLSDPQKKIKYEMHVTCRASSCAPIRLLSVPYPYNNWGFL